MGNSLKMLSKKDNFVPTKWQNVGDLSGTMPEQTRTSSMELSLELMEIESQISQLISKNEKERTEDDLKELKRLINYKELKSKQLNHPNARTSGKLWE